MPNVYILDHNECAEADKGTIFTILSILSFLKKINEITFSLVSTEMHWSSLRRYQTEDRTS